MALSIPQIMKWGNSLVSDHNRSELDLSPQAIETSGRMVNGTLRKYSVATKYSVSASWDMLPGTAVGVTGAIGTVDGGMGAKEMKAYYDANKGKVVVTLYDGAGATMVLNMMFTDFSITIQKRGFQDFWSVSCTLDEI